ncbi:MAG: isopenicillin N synthase family dioxygenase [Granulosicoccus sp.]
MTEASTMHPNISILDLTDRNAINLPLLAGEFTSATQQCGFVYVRIDESTSEVIKTIRHVQRRFFNQTIENKNRVAIDVNNRGYLANGKALMQGARRHDQKEVFFWGREVADDDPDVLSGVPLCGPNQWPGNLPELKDAVIAYSEVVRQIGDLLLDIIARSVNAPADFFKPYYQRPMLRGQLLRYPETEHHEDQFGVAPHSDFGCITLLLQESDGLEVLFPDGQWVAAPPIENTLIVNIGDLLERWSNNRFPSTRHRVRNKSNDSRYSIAMFYDPSPTAVIDPLDLLPEEPAMFSAVGAADYILSKNRVSFSHYKSEEKSSRA